MRHLPETLALAAALLACPQVAPPADARPAAAPAPAPPVLMLYHQRCLFVPVRIGEQDLTFLLDTGASASAVDRATAERLQLSAGPATTVEGTAGIVETATCRIPRLSVGGVQVDEITATAQDLGGIPAPEGRRTDGILGHDVLRTLSLRIDFAARTLSLAAAPAEAAFPADTAPKSGSAAAVAFVLDNGIPRLPAVLNGDVKTEFRLDTGASLFDTPDVYLNITQDDWARLQAAEPGLAAEGALQGSGPSGVVTLPVAHIRSLALGDLVVPAPYAIVQPRVGYFARADAVGFLSNNLLEKFSPVIIDYPARRLWLTRPQAPAPDAGN